jgi:transposase
MKQTVANVNVEIVKRSDGTKGFAVLSKRWIVERTFAWLNRCRRLAKAGNASRRRPSLSSIWPPSA